jgi:hypothetical protein
MARSKHDDKPAALDVREAAEGVVTPAEASRLYDAVMLAAPLALLGVVLLVLVWRWPTGRGP